MMSLKETLGGLISENQMIAMLDTPYEGILGINKENKIFFINQFFLDLFQRELKDMIGKDIRDFVPKCRLPETIVKGYSEWGETLIINNKEILVGRFPIKNNNIVIGAVLKTIFPDMIVGKSITEKLANPIKNQGRTVPLHLHTCMDLVGETPAMLYVKKMARRASRTNSTLLIYGESGTGKEVVAQAIHTRSVRRDAPFISINCGAIPTTLIESELFGYVAGAFTGAGKCGNAGKFELANGGTILLDEIGDMPLDMQVKLLRVLQEKEVWRIGAHSPVALDVRVIASTNQDLKAMIQSGKFREDLYYRLNILMINTPPLRECQADLPDLIRFLLYRINQKIGTSAKGISESSMEIAMNYDWPGNVRELENLLEQAVNWSDSELVELNKIPQPPWILSKANATIAPATDEIKKLSALETNERELIIDILKQVDGNRVQAAKKLGIARSVLYRKLKKFQIG